MKSKLYYLFFLLFGSCISACSSGDSGDDGPGGNGDSGLVLAVDHDSIPQITGKAVFTITFNGKDITKQASIIDKATMKPMEGNVFSMTKPGDYTFYAAALGSVTNDVTVTVVPAITRLLQKNVLYQAMTSINCSMCPLNHRAMEKEIGLNPGRSCVLAYHGNFAGVIDPFTVDYTAVFQKPYGLSGTFGPILADHWFVVNPDDMSQVSKRYLLPGYVGLSINTTLTGNSATITVNIRALDEIKGVHKLGVAIVEDKLPHRQNDDGIWIEDYVHNDVLRHFLTEVFGEQLPDGTINPQKDASRTYTWNNIPANFNKNNLRVVAFLMEDSTPDGKLNTKNCRDVKLGENADFQYFDYFEQ